MLELYNCINEQLLFKPKYQERTITFWLVGLTFVFKNEIDDGDFLNITLKTSYPFFSLLKTKNSKLEVNPSTPFVVNQIAAPESHDNAFCISKRVFLNFR